MEMTHNRRHNIDIDKLVKQKKILNDTINELDETKKILRNHIEKMNEYMYKYCVHEWEYYRESPYDSSDKLCRRCHQFQSLQPFHK